MLGLGGFRFKLQISYKVWRFQCLAIVGFRIKVRGPGFKVRGFEGIEA